MSTDKQIYLHGRGGAVGEDGSDGHSNNGGGYEDKGVDRNENQKRSNDGRKDESSHRSTFAHFQGSITWYHKNPHPLLHIEAGTLTHACIHVCILVYACAVVCICKCVYIYSCVEKAFYLCKCLHSVDCVFIGIIDVIIAIIFPIIYHLPLRLSLWRDRS